MRNKFKSQKGLLWAGTSVATLCAGLAFAAPVLAQNATEAAPAKPDDTVVVVTARRKALQSATERKKNSDTMIESVVADEAGKLPDNSITEVLQRVSGVTMVRFAALNDPDHFSAEGSGIQVRGLSGVTGTVNGREVFSANGGSGLQWGEVTPELMAAVDVYKANRADMIEGGTGGSIDLRTKMPFDYKAASIEGSLGGSYGDYAKKLSANGSILATKRWDTPIGEIGVLVDLAHSDYSAADSFIRTEPYFKRNVDGVDRYVPGGFDWGDDQFNRKRDGIYEALQWRPNDRITFYQTFFQSEYKSNNTGAGAFLGDRGGNYNQAGIMPTGNATYDDNGALISADHLGIVSNGAVTGQTTDQGWIPAANQVTCSTPYGSQLISNGLNWSTSPSVNGGYPTCATTALNVAIGSSRGFNTSDNVTRDFSQGFNWSVTDRLRIRGDLQFVDSAAHSMSMGVGLHSFATSYSQDLSGDYPVFTINNADTLSNKANYGWDNMSYRTTNNHGTMGAVTLDVDYDLGDGFFKALKVGARYANRVERDNYDGTYWAALGRDWNNSPQRDLTAGSASDTELYAFDNFFRGEVALPGQFYFPSAQLIQSGDALYIQNTYGYNNQYKKAANATDPQDAQGYLLDANGNRIQDAAALPQVYHDPYGFARTQVITRSIYAQVKFGSDEGLFGVPFSGNLGLRVVRNKVEASGFYTYGDNKFYMTQAEANADLADDGEANNPYVTTPTGFTREDGVDYTRYLPSINVTFKPSPQFFIRAAANETMSPAGYNDIRAVGSGGVTLAGNANNVVANPALGIPEKTYPGIFIGATTNSGNPKLLPTMSQNLDLSLEWYPSNNFNGHFDVFHKTIKDLIVYGDTSKPFTGTYTRVDGTSTTVTTQIVSTEVYNSKEDATVNGFEVGGRKFFDELPAPFNGLGIEANYTYIDSKNPGAKALDINGQPMPDMPIIGMSKDNYNIVLMYEHKKLSLRAAYSWRSRYLQTTNANGTNGTYCYVNPGVDTACAAGTSGNPTIGLPVYGADYGQLDVGLNYNINDHLRLWIQGNNVTNAVTKTQMEILPGKRYTRSWFVYDQRIDVGLNFKF